MRFTSKPEEATQVVRDRVGAYLGDEGASPWFDSYQAPGTQEFHRFPDNASGYAQPLGQLTLGRQPVTLLKLSRANELFDMVGDLFVQPLSREPLIQLFAHLRPTAQCGTTT